MYKILNIIISVSLKKMLLKLLAQNYFMNLTYNVLPILNPL